MIEHEPSLLVHIGLGAWVKFIEIDALIGAFIGASVFTAKTKKVTWFMKLGGLFISALCGYFFAIEAKDFVNEILGRFFNYQFKRLDILACILAIVSIPILSGLVDWANNFDVTKMIDNKLEDLVERRRKKRQNNDDEDNEI